MMGTRTALLAVCPTQHPLSHVPLLATDGISLRPYTAGCIQILWSTATVTLLASEYYGVKLVNHYMQR